MRLHEGVRFRIAVSTLVVSLCLPLWTAEGQVRTQYGPRRVGRSRSVGQAGVPLSIRTFVGVGNRTRVSTPQFQTGGRVGRTAYRVGGERGSDWARIFVEYDTEPDWMDDISFSYFVLALHEEGSERTYSFFRRAVDYKDIARGSGHVSAVYLHPTTLARYGEPVAAHVEIRVAGKLVASSDDLRGDMEGDLPESWWTSKEVLDNAKVTVREGYLMNRKETPFELINIENNEVIR